MQKKLIAFIGIILSSLFLAGCTLPFQQKKKAVLRVETNLKATVFLNENHVGQTPYENQQLNPSEYTLKLVPEAGSTILTWQGVVKLSEGIMTIVSRNLADTEEQASGYILSLEPISEKTKARIAVIGTPDSVLVKLDGEPKGFAPISIDDVSEGEKILSISSPGFREETIKAKAVKGYKLLVNVQLAKEIAIEEPGISEEATASAKPSVSTKPKSSPSPSVKPVDRSKTATPSGTTKRPYVLIKDTPTGWLNVRSEPTTSEDNILTKIYPQEEYKFIEQNETGWYKIEYEMGKQGWISAKYCTLYK